jgi:hypothetical protein
MCKFTKNVCCTILLSILIGYGSAFAIFLIACSYFDWSILAIPAYWYGCISWYELLPGQFELSGAVRKCIKIYIPGWKTYFTPIKPILSQDTIDIWEWEYL